MFTRPIARPPSPPAAHPPVTGARLLRAGAVLPASGAPAPTDPTDALRSPFSLTTLLAHHAEGADEVMVRRVGLLGLAGARMCPNLLQRRLGPGSAARRSAEYQRFSSRTPMESRPLQQIWTTGATADLSGAAGVAPPDRKVIHRAVMRVRDAGTAPPSPSSSPLTPTPSPSPTTSPGPPVRGADAARHPLGAGVVGPAPARGTDANERTRASRRPRAGADPAKILDDGIDGLKPTSGPARTRPGLRNASPARRSPPRLAPCEPGATKSGCARSARAHLAQCEPR